MRIGLIPRVRVNYNLLDLIKALFVCENNTKYRDSCEKFFYDLYDGRPVMLVGSARAALYYILKSLPHKKVVLPAYNCEVVGEAAEYAGKEIIYAECDKLTFNIKTLPELDGDTVVIVAHQYGYPCDIKEIKRKCNEAGAVLIEDCAAALGTMVDGQRAGTFGDYAVVSFNASKLLHVPSKGGLIIAKELQKLDAVRNVIKLKTSDISFKAKHLFRGLVFCLCKNVYVYRLFHYLTMGRSGKLRRNEGENYTCKPDDSYEYMFAEWQGSILKKQLSLLNYYIEKNQLVLSYYNEKINNPLIERPRIMNGTVCSRYPFYVKNKKAFYSVSCKHGVDLDSSHSRLTCPNTYENEWTMAHEVLNIPILGLTKKEVAAVVNVVNALR